MTDPIIEREKAERIRLYPGLLADRNRLRAEVNMLREENAKLRTAIEDIRDADDERRYLPHHLRERLNVVDTLNNA